MNRYITDGIVRDVADGKNVVIAGKSLRQSEQELDLAIEADPEAWARISKASGNKRATHSGGGTVRPMAATASLRGAQADVLLVLDFRALDEKQRAEVLAARHAIPEVLLNN